MMVFIVCFYRLLKDFFQYKETNESVKDLVKDAIEENTETQEENLLINWEKLHEINEDIIGWINIKGTNINYPILKDNNLYYLKHSYDKKYNNNGSIFTMNNQPFKEQETIIYGHNMRNGIMFSELSKYLEEKFFYEHLNFNIYTTEYTYKATIFSSYSIDVNEEENNIRTLNFDEEIEYYKNASKYSVSDIANIERIVKLSTCSYLNTTTRPTNKRYFIIAKIEIID